MRDGNQHVIDGAGEARMIQADVAMPGDSDPQPERYLALVSAGYPRRCGRLRLSRPESLRWPFTPSWQDRIDEGRGILGIGTAARGDHNEPEQDEQPEAYPEENLHAGRRFQCSCYVTRSQARLYS
jgi:hypothetical protein